MTDAAEETQTVRIIVAEDNRDLQSMMRMTLEVAGFKVLPEIHAIAPHCKVVIHSAIAAMFVTESALRAGAVA